jgi:predicted XRE-type DNA-binding protein
MTTRPVRRLATSAHVTLADGNVFADLGFPPAEAANLKLRADLAIEVHRTIAGMTQVHAAKLLGVSQPRVSDLSRGKLGLFTIDALVNMLANAGMQVTVSAAAMNGRGRRVAESPAKPYRAKRHKS